MKLQRIIKIYCILLVGIVTACSNDSEEYDLTRFRYDLATCLHDENTLTFLRDDSVTLYPQPPIAATTLPAGQRVFIGYAPIGAEKGRTTTIEMYTAVQSILTGDIPSLTNVEIDKLADEPLYLTTAWCSGRHINISYKAEYNNRPQTLTMVAPIPQASPDTLDVQLHYNRRGDAPGYYVPGYASYLLPDDVPPVIRARINTSNLGGEKYFIWEIND